MYFGIFVVQPACFGAGCYIKTIHSCHQPSEHVLVRGENEFLAKTGRSWAVYESIRKIATARMTKISVPSQSSLRFFPLMARNDDDDDDKDNDVDGAVDGFGGIMGCCEVETVRVHFQSGINVCIFYKEEFRSSFIQRKN